MAGLANGGERAVEVMGQLWRWYLIITLINIIMYILPFMKYNAAQKAQALLDTKDDKTTTSKNKKDSKKQD